MAPPPPKQKDKTTKPTKNGKADTTGGATGTPVGAAGSTTGSTTTGGAGTTTAGPVTGTTPPAPDPASTRAETAHQPVSNSIRATRAKHAADALHARNAPKPEPGLEHDYDILGDFAEAIVGDGGRKARNEYVELKGNASLALSDEHRMALMFDKAEDDLARAVDDDGTVTVAPLNVRFGDIAHGSIPVTTEDDLTLSTPGWVGIPFDHPGLPPLDAWWALALRVSHDVVDGELVALDSPLVETGPASIDMPHPHRVHAGNAQSYLGLEDLQELSGSFRNALSGGHLDFGYSSMSYLFDGLFNGDGSLLLSDDKPVTFGAKAEVTAEGIDEQPVTIKRNVLGELSVHTDLKADFATGEGYHVGGRLKALFERGVVDIRGELDYKAGSTSGRVTVMIADQETAWDAVRQRLGDKAPPVVEKLDSPNGLAFVGWGTVNFHLNDWLSGDAEVVLDPDGYVTAMGSLRPTAELQLFGKKEKKPSNLIDPESFSIWVEGVRLGLKLKVTTSAFVGPGTLSEITVDGVFSTRPHTPTEFHVSGLFKVPAHADLVVDVTGDATAVGLLGLYARIRGIAALDAQLFVRPHIGRVKHGSDPSKASFYVGGILGAEAAMSVGIAGSIGGVIHTWIFGDIEKTFLDTGPHQWKLGSGRVSVQGTYLLGNKDNPLKEFAYQAPELDTSTLENALRKLSLDDFPAGASSTSKVTPSFRDDYTEAQEPAVQSLTPASGQPSEPQLAPTVAQPEIPSFEAAPAAPQLPVDKVGATDSVSQAPDAPQLPLPYAPPPKQQGWVSVGPQPGATPPGGPGTPPPTGPTTTPATPTAPTTTPGAPGVAPDITSPPTSEPDPTLTKGLPPIIVPFKMGDTHHNLYLVRATAPPYILMASPQIDRLQTDLQIARNVVRHERNQAADGVTTAGLTVDELDEEIEYLDYLMTRREVVEKNAIKQAASGHVTGLESLAGDLSAYGRLFGRNDLLKNIRALPNSAVVPDATPTDFQQLVRKMPARALRIRKDYQRYAQSRTTQHRKKMTEDDYLQMRARFALGYRAEQPSIKLYAEESGIKEAVKNNRNIYPTKPADPDYPQRIPDVYLPGKVIADVKNVGHQGATAQIYDDTRIADLSPGEFYWDKKKTDRLKRKTPRFDLIVRAPWHERGPTDVEPEVEQLVGERKGRIYELIEDPEEPAHDN